MNSPYKSFIPPLLSIALLLALLMSNNTWADKPALLLANTYASNKYDIQEYWVSEKFDGVRAFWDGQQLRSRGGNRISVPAALLAQLPPENLDGELWIVRRHFEEVSRLVRQQSSTPEEWLNVKYMVFDLPNHPGTFDERYQHINLLYQASSTTATFWRPVEQYKIGSDEELQNKLQTIVRAGGEGLMLHKGSSLYKGVRSDDLLKVKTYDDAEATVISILEGKGKYQGMMGALKVRTDDGRLFKIGTGFSDAERKNPPQVGSRITYKYFGLTHKGNPRFASFLRVREQD